MYQWPDFFFVCQLLSYFSQQNSMPDAYKDSNSNGIYAIYIQPIHNALGTQDLLADPGLAHIWSSSDSSCSAGQGGNGRTLSMGGKKYKSAIVHISKIPVNYIFNSL